MLTLAWRLARETSRAVKVLPMTMAEFYRFAGVTASDLAMTPEAEAEMRKLVVTTLREAMVEANHRSTRVEARDTLIAMGEAVAGRR